MILQPLSLQLALTGSLIKIGTVNINLDIRQRNMNQGRPLQIYKTGMGIILEDYMILRAC